MCSRFVKPLSREFDSHPTLQIHDMGYKNKADKAAFDKRRKAGIDKFVRDYLESHPCVDCGNPDIRVLEFDHVRGKKLYCIGVGGLKSIRLLKEEILKCYVRCANCHKIRHRSTKVVLTQE
jgi:hypothetical protein